MKSGEIWLCLVFGMCSVGYPSQVSSGTPKLKDVHSWGQLEFEYASPSDRQRDIDSGVFIPGSFSPIDVDVYYSPDSIDHNEIFITIPRFTPGIPATLGTVTDKKLNENPIIKPFPDWSWHRDPPTCQQNRLVSVFRTRIDGCGRFWVLDTGKIGTDSICTPQIIAFNLTTNQVLHRRELPPDVTPGIYLLVTPEIDIREDCRNTFIYVADVQGFAIIVYDVANDKLWRVQDKTFYPFPPYGTYTIQGESFELMDGVLGMALSPYIRGQDRILFYHAMSSPTENWVYTSYLRNSSLYKNNPAATPFAFNPYKGKRDTQVAAEALNKDGIMLFGLVGEGTIVCWNTRTEYGTKYFDVLVQDPVRITFATGLKIIMNKKGEEELWILSTRYQKIATGTLSTTQTNFRILAAKVDDLLFGSKCRKRNQPNPISGPYANTRGG